MYGSLIEVAIVAVEGNLAPLRNTAPWFEKYGSLIQVAVVAVEVACPVNTVVTVGKFENYLYDWKSS